MNTRPDIKGLSDLMARLRSPGGCPWDREQTLASLVPYIIEEAYEVVSAIDGGSPEAIRDELGDLLFQVVFASRLAEEKGWFTLGDVIDGNTEKMVRRHPHVFGSESAETPEEVLGHWHRIKEGEKKAAGPEGALGGVPDALPALLRAHKVTQKAARAGFDWQDVADVLGKVAEEMEEFREAAEKKDAAAMEEELGDLLFTIVNVARFVEVNPEEALRKTIGKFITRFHHVERTLEGRGQDLSTASMDDMERLWEDAKKLTNKKIKESESL
ncbi:MAG: nucleoside triphosphate pyrophosphohydrolase [Thermodesulfobacteriota bacterium]